MIRNYYSISLYPGKTGETYYNKYFKLKNLPYTYTALKCTNLSESVNDLLNRNASGFSVSMPYKQQIISYLDVIDKSVSDFSSCNTVVINDGKLHGYNTDYYGMIHLLKSATNNINILGNGAMGSMFKKLLGDDATVYSRSLGNWKDIHNITGTMINCTGLGTSVMDSPFVELPKLDCVIDLAMSDNILKKQCVMHSVKYVEGKEFYHRQFKNQFEIYTGVILAYDEITDKN